MRPALRRFVAAAQAFTLSSVLSACLLAGGDSLVVPGGAEDFPNTVTPLGRLAVVDVSAVGDWEQVPVVTPPMPPMPSLDSLQIVPPNGGSPGLGKIGAAGKAFVGIDTLNMDLWTVDTVRVIDAYFFGRIYAYAFDSSETHVRRDTVSALYLGDRSQLGFSRSSLEAVRDSIMSNPGKFLLQLEFRGTLKKGAAGAPETWVRQSYRLRNLDFAGTMDQAEYETVTPLPAGGSQRKWVKIYGPEGAYASPDAVPEEFELLQRGRAGDTVSWTLVKDADWDRKLWTHDGSGVVDLHFRVRNPENEPGIMRIHSTLRAAYQADSSASGALRQLSYQEQRWLRNGRNVTFTFRGLAATDGLLVGGDTARMTVDTVYALKDSLIKYSAVYKMLLGPVPERMQEHKLAAYSVNKYWRFGDLFSNASHFFPETPVPVGQTGFAGRMSTTSIYLNGDTVTTQGSIDAAGFNLQVRNVRKNVVTTYDVVLNAAGDLVRYTPVAADATQVRPPSSTVLP